MLRHDWPVCVRGRDLAMMLSLHRSSCCIFQREFGDYSSLSEQNGGRLSLLTGSVFRVFPSWPSCNITLSKIRKQGRVE